MFRCETQRTPNDLRQYTQQEGLNMASTTLTRTLLIVTTLPESDWRQDLGATNERAMLVAKLEAMGYTITFGSYMPTKDAFDRVLISSEPSENHSDAITRDIGMRSRSRYVHRRGILTDMGAIWSPEDVWAEPQTEEWERCLIERFG